MTPQERKALEAFERKQEQKKADARKAAATKHPRPRGPVPGEKKSRRGTGDHGKED